MKKLLNKSIGLVLAVFLFVSLLVAGAATIDFSLLRTKAEYSRDYSELTDEELDTLSFRTSVSDDSPQITVLRMAMVRRRLIGQVTTIIILLMKKPLWWGNYAENLTGKTEKNPILLFFKLRWSTRGEFPGTKKSIH